MKWLLEFLLAFTLGIVHCLLLALPVMWLTAFLHDQGWPLTPLGYWASFVVAFLTGWIIDGAGTVRRAVEAAKR